MNKIFLNLISIFAVAAIAATATVAYFSDTETSTGNTFAAGTLDLKVDDQDDPNIVNVADDDNGLLEPEKTAGDSEDEEGELSQYLLMKLNAPGSTGYAYPNQPECLDSGSKCPLNTWDDSEIGKSSPWEIWQAIAAGTTNAPMG